MEATVIVLRDPDAARALGSDEIRALALRRFEMLSMEEPYDPEVMGYFIVVEPGDSLAALTEQLGFDVLRSRFSGDRYDAPSFTPSFEILEEHSCCFEIVFVLGDDGFGVEVFVPKAEGIAPDLLAMCAMHGVPSNEAPEP